MELVSDDSEQIDGILFPGYRVCAHIGVWNGHHHVNDAVLSDNLLLDVFGEGRLVAAVAAHAKLSELCLALVVYILFRSHSQAEITEAAVGNSITCLQVELNAVAFPVAVGFPDVAVAADYPEIQVVLIPTEVQVRRDLFHLFILGVVFV